MLAHPLTVQVLQAVAVVEAEVAAVAVQLQLAVLAAVEL
jgi:hypothetical protein